MTDGGVPEQGVLLPIYRGQEVAAALLTGLFLGFAIWGWIDILTHGGGWRQPSSTAEAGVFALIGVAATTVSFWFFAGAAWRVLDGDAIAWFDADGLHCHPSIGPRLISWNQIAGSSTAYRRGRYISIRYVQVDFTHRHWGWYAPFGTMRLRIMFGHGHAAADEAMRIIRRFCTVN